MPYITEQERTERINHGGLYHSRKKIAETMAEFAENGGQLNYMISLVISTYLKRQGLKYDVCQDILGMLEILKSEFIANVVNPYEELKSTENGDNIYAWVDNEIEKYNDTINFVRSTKD